MNFDDLSRQYVGRAAREYNIVREGGRKWQQEQNAIAELLRDLPNGLKTLDVPVGTGRLFGFYKTHAFEATGIDVSTDMLSEAGARSKALEITVDLRQGDIRNISFPDASFDLVLCIRFLNWLDAAGFRASLAELTRVSRDRLLVGIRHLTPIRDFRAVPLDLIRVVRRSLGHPQARARRSGLVYHAKSDVQSAFADLGLVVDAHRVVEKRSDGTDYLIYMLRKQRAA